MLKLKGQGFSLPRGTELLSLALVCEVFDGEILEVRIPVDPVKSRKREEEDVENSIKYATLVCTCGSEDFYVIKYHSRSFDVQCRECGKVHGNIDLPLAKKLVRINPHYVMHEKKVTTEQLSLDLDSEEIFRTKKGEYHDS